MDNFGGGDAERLLIFPCVESSAKPVKGPGASRPSVVAVSVAAVTRTMHAEWRTAPSRLDDCCALVADLALVNSSK